MRRLVATAGLALLAASAHAEVKGEEQRVGDTLVRITVDGNLESLAVGRSETALTQVLSSADIEILAATEDADSVALVGAPVLVVETFGTHSCEAGDARAYYVVTLGDVAAPEGPVTTCTELTVSLTSGAVVLQSDPMGDDGEFWAWVPGKGWGSQLD